MLLITRYCTSQRPCKKKVISKQRESKRQRLVKELEDFDKDRESKRQHLVKGLEDDFNKETETNRDLIVEESSQLHEKNERRREPLLNKLSNHVHQTDLSFLEICAEASFLELNAGILVVAVDQLSV